MAEYAIRSHQTDGGAWCWVVSFSRDSKPHEKRFYWIKLGGEAKALQQAKMWRDAELARTPVLTIQAFCEKKRSSNTSDVPGVHFLMPRRQPDGIWQAKLKVAGEKARTKSFSVLKHGDDEAYRLAVLERQSMLAKIGARPYVHDPTAKDAAERQLQAAKKADRTYR